MLRLRNPNLIWWSYFLLIQTFLIASYLMPSSGVTSERKVTKMITFDQRHNSGMVRPTDNEHFPKNTYLGKINQRSKRSTAKNQTQGQIGLQKEKSGGDCDEPTPFLPPVIPKRKTEVESCSNRCSNRTRFASSQSRIVPHCHCDSSCNDIFMDCCSDYTRHCRDNVRVETEPVYLSRSYFRCVTNILFSINTSFNIPGVWMISRCPKEWSNDSVRENCHEVSTKLNNSAYNSFVPVFSPANNLTYRNQYCALCHNVVDYELWSLVFLPVSIQSDVKRAQHGGSSHGVKPKDHRPLRYCFFPSVVKTCPGLNRSAHERCVNGSVEIVTKSWKSGEKYYKNRACASCHGVKSPRSVHKFPVSCYNVQVFNDGIGISPREQIFDPYLGACRMSYRTIPGGSQDVYMVVMSLSPTTRTASITKAFLREDMAENFNLNRSQVTGVQLFKKILNESIVTFTLRLKPLQTFVLASGTLGVKGSEAHGLRRLFRFQKPFRLKLFNETEYTVYNITVHRLTCVHRHVYTSEEFVVLRGQRIHVNSTGVIYEANEYDSNATDLSRFNSTATVCLKLVPSRCNGSYISLSPSEYDLLPNLTLLYHSSRHDFGDYAYENGTVAICVGFERKYHICTSSKPRNHLKLTLLSIVGSITSVICLFCLIVTYSIFKELRTLPGKNLMSMAVSLAFVELFWVSGSMAVLNQDLCTAFAIANHYFGLVYFTASSVIAFHTCSVFGKNITPRRSQEENMRTFIVYSVITWGIPALFVVTFSLLDRYGLFLVNYGSLGFCWLGTIQSKLYLFVLPLGALVSFNLVLFLFIAVSLCRNRKANAQVLAHNVQRSRDKEIYSFASSCRRSWGFPGCFFSCTSSPKQKLMPFCIFVIFLLGFKVCLFALLFF